MKRLDHFGVTEEQLRALVAEGLRSGGDWCDLYFEDTAYHDLLLRDGEVASGGYHVDYGCGIRVLKGEKTGYAYAESTDFPSLLQAARAAGAIACTTSSPSGQLPPETSFGPHRCAPLAVPPLTMPRVAGFPGAVSAGVQNDTTKKTGGWLPLNGAAEYYTERLPWEEAETAPFVAFLKRIEAGIRARDSRTLKVVAILSYSVSDVLMFNSLGELTADHRPLGSISVQVVFRQGDRTADRQGETLSGLFGRDCDLCRRGNGRRFSRIFPGFRLHCGFAPCLFLRRDVHRARTQAAEINRRPGTQAGQDIGGGCQHRGHQDHHHDCARRDLSLLPVHPPAPFFCFSGSR